MRQLHLKLLISLLLFVFAGRCLAVEEGAALVHAFAAPAVLGMKLSAKKGNRRGVLGDKELTCVLALEPSEFYPAVRRLLDANLTPTELVAANGFFQSTVGQKYAKHGLLQVYPAVGERAPEPLPDISDAEYKHIEVFSTTAVGHKFFNDRFMQRVAARQALDERIQELLAQCGAN